MADSKALDPNDKTWMIGCAIPIVLLCALVYGCNTDSSSTFDEEVNGRTALQMSLRDPGSMEVRNAFVSATGAYCGEVNANNGFGGKTGFKRFVVKSGVASIDVAGEIAPIWNIECS